MTASEKSRLLELERERARRAAQRSLAAFTRLCWNIIEPTVHLRWTWHIDAICDHLQAVTEGRIQRLLINIPPGHIKSILVCVMWPAWEWLERPYLRSIFGSYDLPLARRDSIRCRDLILSPLYQWLIPRDEDGKPRWALAQPTLQETFTTTAKGFRGCTSPAGGGGTGHRGHKVGVDDPLKAIDATSEAAKRTANDWHEKTLSSRLVDPATGSRVLVMQRLAQDDPSGRALEQGGWDHLCLPSEYEGPNVCACPEGTRCSQRGGTSIGFVDPRTEKGELLNPLFFTREVIELAKLDLGPDFYGQHQQRPAPPGGNIVKADWLTQSTYKYLPETPGEWRIYGDLKNGSKQPRSSMACYGVWFMPRGTQRFYLVDVVTGRWDQVEEERELEALAKRYPAAGKIGLEDKADAKGVIAHLRDVITGLVAVKGAPGDKADRLRACLHLFQAGNVYLPESAPWLASYVGELTMFPGASNDDQVDMTTLALNDIESERQGTQELPWWAKQ